MNNSLRTKLLILGLSDKSVSSFDSSFFDVYNGNYGYRIDCRNGTRNCGKLICDVPDNIQEYDVLVLSFDEIKTVSNNTDIDGQLTSSDRVSFFYCESPATLLDPVPFICSNVILSKFHQKKKPFIKIVFVSDQIPAKTSYCIIERSNIGSSNRKAEINDYEIFSCGSYEKIGTIINVADGLDTSLKTTLEKYLSLFAYKRILYCGKDNVLPILLNDEGEVVGYIRRNDNHCSIFLPEMTDYERKGDLIIDLIQNYFSAMLPELFSGLNNKKWLDDTRFKSSEEQSLDLELSRLNQQYEKDKREIENKIISVREKNQYLLDLISSDSELLVSSVAKYLRWLGFKKVENCDEIQEKKEEDIRVIDNKDQLLIEVKGITYLPTERDCNQIDKVVNRRKQPGYSGIIHPVFIVNHEKNISPLCRKKKVFTDQEIEDAKGMNRALITTWNMYQTYERIQAGIIPKKTIRDCFWKDGLVCFDYPEEKKIGTITRIFKSGFVGVICVSELGTKIGEKVIYIKDDDWSERTVVRIVLNNSDCTDISSKEVSIEFDSSVSIGGRVYAKLENEQENDNDE